MPARGTPSRRPPGPEEQPVKTTDWTESSDAALVVAVGRFDQAALAEAYRRHGGAVFALARRMCGDRAVAEEVTQEIFLRLWDDPQRFDPGRGALRSFLMAQAHGRAVDQLRSETARKAREQRQVRESVAAAGYDLDREANDMINSEQVKDALAKLPEDEREAIVLAYYGGHTYREVASRLGRPEGTVKSRIRSGLRRLREEMSDATV
jgi:RNA polymerase sigma-70 factor, ECF subfamily